MVRLKLLILVLMGVTIQTGATADDRSTVQAMISICAEGNRERYDFGTCTGRIEGFVQGWLWARLRSAHDAKLTKPLESNFCPPEGLTVGQTTTIFLNWANENPEKWHWKWDRGLLTSLVESFPCGIE